VSKRDAATVACRIAKKETKVQENKIRAAHKPTPQEAAVSVFAPNISPMAALRVAQRCNQTGCPRAQWLVLRHQAERRIDAGCDKKKRSQLVLMGYYIKSFIRNCAEILRQKGNSQFRTSMQFNYLMPAARKSRWNSPGLPTKYSTRSLSVAGPGGGLFGASSSMALSSDPFAAARLSSRLAFAPRRDLAIGVHPKEATRG